MATENIHEIIRNHAAGDCPMVAMCARGPSDNMPGSDIDSKNFFLFSHLASDICPGLADYNTRGFHETAGKCPRSRDSRLCWMMMDREFSR